MNKMDKISKGRRVGIEAANWQAEDVRHCFILYILLILSSSSGLCALRAFVVNCPSFRFSSCFLRPLRALRANLPAHCPPPTASLPHCLTALLSHRPLPSSIFRKIVKIFCGVSAWPG